MPAYMPPITDPRKRLNKLKTPAEAAPTAAAGAMRGITPEPAQTAASEFEGAATDFPGKAKIEAGTEAIREKTRRMAQDTDTLAARTKATQGRIQTGQQVQDGETLDGFKYTPEQRQQVEAGGGKFRYDLPEDLAVKRKRLTDPGFMPGKPPAESTPEEYQGTVDRMNEKYYPELKDVAPEDRKYGFRYDPQTGGVVGVGNPEQQARAEQQKQERLARARTDLTEARAKGISIGELREQRRELARADHERQVAEAGTPRTEQPAPGQGAATSAFDRRVQRSQEQYAQALAEGGDVKAAAAGTLRAHREAGVGPFAENPKSEDRALFVNQVGQLIGANPKMTGTRASVMNEALSEVSLADVQFLIQNPTAANARELEDRLLDDLFKNDAVADDDIRGLGAAILNAYGLDFNKPRGPQAP